ncbi:MAG: TonB-dependent receptor, partial [Deltaproteobacteria bacterium]|nr:TonB-dependent receptor [Deltaproteobacteria bacterium]
EDYFSPQLGLKFKPLNWLALKANLARYVREPSFFELFGDRGFFVGNEELKAEKGLNFDLGFEISWLPNRDWLSRVSCRAAYFRSDVDDLITRVYDARGVGRSVNISRARIQGLEAGLNLDFLEYFRLTLNATWQNAENQSQVKAFDGKKLPGRFGQSYLGRLEARYKGFKVYGECAVDKDMYYDTANLLQAEDKVEFNAGISWLFRSFLLSFEAKNIGDDRYEDFNGYPLPGRSFCLTLRSVF